MIIPLIQALYDPQIPIPQHLAFYEKAVEDIEMFTISPQVCYLLQEQGQMDRTPLFFQERLKQKHAEALYLTMLIKSQTEQIFRKFEETGIPAIPLKGTRFAEKYFGHIRARGTSDIDLLIKRNEVHKAVEAVKSLGYTWEQERIRSHFHWSFSKRLPHSPIPLTVELHWDLLNENTSDLPIDEFWHEAEPLQPYTHIKELSDFHTFYMICLHGWRHNLNSLKYFIDIIQLIHVLQDRLDYSRLFQDAASHRTLKRTSRILTIVYSYFPHLESMKEHPFPKSTRLWWDYEGIRNYNRSLKNYVNWIYYHLFDYDTVKHGVKARLWKN